jgi:hypothetical protein
MRSISRKAASIVSGVALASGGVFFVAPAVQAAPAGAPGQAKCSHDIPNEYTMTDATVHLRSRSSSHSTSLGLVKRATWVEKRCVNNNRKWVKLRVDGGPNKNRVGWVAKKYLSIPMEPSVTR